MWSEGTSGRFSNWAGLAASPPQNTLEEMEILNNNAARLFSNVQLTPGALRVSQMLEDAGSGGSAATYCMAEVQ